MAGTRSSARLAAKQGSSPESSPKPAAGTKHKADAGSSPAAKKIKKSSKKEQKTLEQSLPNNKEETDGGEKAEPTENGADSEGSKEAGNGSKQAEDTEMKEADEESKESADDKTETPKKSPKAKTANSGNNAVEPQAREQETPSNILEKGIIYFFFRPRVNVEEPESVKDIQRSYIILRPIPHGASLSDGPIGDEGTNRLFALPKKVLPASGRDRFMTFVEKAKVTFQVLKDEFLASSDYVTKTRGTQHLSAPTPVGEGVYAITTTGRESHLAYILTIPSESGEVQKAIGLKDQGSFILSTRNPEYPAPNNAQLPEGPNFPKEIQEEFNSLRWAGTRPHHLDIPNCQFLLIGSSSGLDAATTSENGKEEETPKEELETLEHEDELRVEGLKGDESQAIFQDLGISAKGYPKVQTTF